MEILGDRESRMIIIHKEEKREKNAAITCFVIQTGRLIGPCENNSQKCHINIRPWQDKNNSYEGNKLTAWKM